MQNMTIAKLVNLQVEFGDYDETDDFGVMAAMCSPKVVSKSVNEEKIDNL